MNSGGSGPCANMMCANNNRNDVSGCRMYSHHAADVLCENYVSPDYASMMNQVICRLRDENRLLRRMNRNLVITGRRMIAEMRSETT